MANFYALLIGIDYYQPNPHFNSLRGAVRDIDKVAAYLDTSLKIPSEQITRLTSPIPDTNSNADVRAARQEQSPTYRNIVKAFDSITEGANAGDLVYIHYSGHGGRVKTIYSDLKGEGQFDECLVPMDVGDDGYYLRDVEMNTLLKRMTDKGLIVTVIFDSCHSGGATRGDGDVRGARDGQVDTNDRPLDSTVADRAELLANWRVTTQNSNKDGWLPNRKDYVFLGACRPTELAYEAAFGTGTERNGALTYWMLDTLNAVPTGLTYQALYDRVTGQIQSKFPNQLPMLLGKGDRLVFGSEIKPVQYSLTVVNVMPGQITLNGGLVQGLSRGARFALYPVGSNFADKQKRLAVVEIIDLQASTATAKILTAEESGVAAVIEQIEPGLPAVMESEPVNLKHRVRLFSKEVGEKEEQLPPELADKQAAALDRVRQAMQSNGWVIEIEGDESGHYQVAVGRKGEYEISRLTPIDNLTPALSIDDPESADLVVKRLVHLAKYKSIEALDNPESKLSIEFELLDENKQPFPDRNNIKLKSGTVYLRVKNNDAQPLNIAILDLEATWEISSIPILGENTVFYELNNTGQPLEMSMDFQIPEGDEYKNRREKLKLFATKGIANFQWLKLPPLDEELISRGANLRGETQKIVGEKSTTRGESVQVNPIDLLFSQIGAGMEEPPQLTRAFRRKPTPNADWITSTIEVGFQ
jgi:Caspase domain